MQLNCNPLVRRTWDNVVVKVSAEWGQRLEFKQSTLITTASRATGLCRIATRYDKIVLSFDCFLSLAASRLKLKTFVNEA